MLNYLNIGCGTLYHPDWVNIDIYAINPEIISHNILEGLPFESNRFEVIYFSQLLEHIPKEKASLFLKECLRVMKPGGIIRIVVPDLENITDEYKKLLEENLSNPNPVSIANYDWILLEMYDQTIRNENGGQMGAYLSQPEIINSDFLTKRIGNSYEIIRDYYLNIANSLNNKNTSPKTLLSRIKKRLRFKNMNFRLALLNILLTTVEKKFFELGFFRNNGEIHYWMYDQYSLKKLIEESGFISIKKKSPNESSIDKWGMYELDIKNDKVYAPTSLFMEGVKPILTSG